MTIYVFLGLVVLKKLSTGAVLIINYFYLI